MRRWIIIIVVLLIVAGAGYWGYEQYVAQQEAEEAAAAVEAESIDELANVIWASGELEPLKWAALNPVNPGLVTAIHVAEGDTVQAGDLLVELDTNVLQSQVEIAEAALVEAQAALDKLLAGATDAEIAAAEAELAAAEAGVSQAAGQMLETQAAIDTANVGVQTAQRQYAEMASHPTAAEMQAAEANIAIAEASVKQAQAAYNQVKGNPQVGALPESQQLNAATASLEAAKAEAAIVAEGATPQQLAVAASSIDAAEAQVLAAESLGPGSEANLEAALARRDSAQAALDKLNEGATAEDIAMAEAGVQSAEAAVQSALAALSEVQITAPFNGQVGEINVRLGELTPIDEDAILLGDTSEMDVRTTDLRETDVVNVAVGMIADVTFDALPDEVFTGTITRIAPVSNTDKGSTNYTVHIAVNDLDERLRWGMTAFVNIQAER